MSEQQQPGRNRKIRFEIPANLNATYANTVIISHNKNEMIFDFIQIMPNDPRARVQQRIVMTPAHARLFLKALEENVSRYEDKFGEIEVPAQPQSLAERLFGAVRPEPGDEGGEDE